MTNRVKFGASNGAHPGYIVAELESSSRAEKDLAKGLSKMMLDLLPQLIANYNIPKHLLGIVMAKAAINLAALSSMAAMDAPLEEANVLKRKLLETLNEAV